MASFNNTDDKPKKFYHDQPLAVYIIIILAFAASVYLLFYSEGFVENIMVELIGAVMFLFIVDQLLLRSNRKRWNVVRNEVEHILSRTLSILRDEILLELFAFKAAPVFDRRPWSETWNERNRKENEKEELEKLELQIIEQKYNYLQEVLQWEDKRLLQTVEENFLDEEYHEYFLDQAENLWRVLNTRYSEHLSVDVVDELLRLNLYLRDLHSGIRTYQKASIYPDRRELYERRGGQSICYNLREVIRSLQRLRKMGYARTLPFDYD